MSLNVLICLYFLVLTKVAKSCRKYLEKNLKDALIFNDHLGAVHAQNLSL